MLPDRWNPRLWLRDWLNAKSPTEQHRADILRWGSIERRDRIHDEVVAEMATAKAAEAAKVSR